MSGTTSGSISTTAATDAKNPLARIRPKAASAPPAQPMAVAITATFKETASALSQSGSVSTAANQRSENPGGGKISTKRTGALSSTRVQCLTSALSILVRVA